MTFFSSEYSEKRVRARSYLTTTIYYGSYFCHQTWGCIHSLRQNIMGCKVTRHCRQVRIGPNWAQIMLVN